MESVCAVVSKVNDTRMIKKRPSDFGARMWLKINQMSLHERDANFFCVCLFPGERQQEKACECLNSVGASF